MTLSLQECQNLVSRHYTAVPGREGKKRKRREHALRVLHLCREIVPQLPPPPLRAEILDRAALLHDIAKFDSDETHHTDAVPFIKKELGTEGAAANSALLDSLDKIISAHKDGFLPPPELAAEAAVLRMADKIDQLRRKRRKAAKNRNAVTEAEESLREAERKVQRARERGDKEKLEKKLEKRNKKEEKLAEKLEKLEIAEAELQKAEKHYQDSCAQIEAYARGESHGSCGPEFAQALLSACGSLKSQPLPAVESLSL